MPSLYIVDPRRHAKCEFTELMQNASKRIAEPISLLFFSLSPHFARQPSFLNEPMNPYHRGYKVIR